MLWAMAKPFSRVWSRSDSLWFRTTYTSETPTRPTTISPNVRTILACSPNRRPPGGSADRLAGLTLVGRFSNPELLHGKGRDSERVHLEPRNLFGQPDEGRGVEEGNQGGRLDHAGFHGPVGVHPELRVHRALRDVQERIHRVIRVAEVVGSAGGVEERAEEGIGI